VAGAPPSKLRKVFGDNIRAARKRIGISQEELADRANVHRTFVGAVERAEVNISLDNIDRISAALETEPSDMLRQL